MANDEIDDGGGSTPDGSEDASLSSIDFSSMLTGSESVDGVDFPLASGINVVRVAQTIIGSVALSVLIGVNTVIQALADAYSALIDGAAGFFGTDLIDATIGAGVSAINGVWAPLVDEFGLGAYFSVLLIVLATFYVADIGVDEALEVLS